MSRRLLTREERALWRHVQRSATPMKGRALDDVIAEAEPKPAPQQPIASLALKPTPRARPSRPPPPPLAPIETKMLRRVRRGSQAIDGALDLHGMTQDAAHRALIEFLHRKQREGASLVIVVTGKGASSPRIDSEFGERGVLRRVVPHWLRLPDLRALVIGFEEAGPRHGGAGALYVRLRKGRVQ